MAAKSRDAEIMPMGPALLPGMPLEELGQAHQKAAARTSATRQAMRMARAAGDLEALERFAQRLRANELEHLELALEIGRRVVLPGQGARTDMAQVPGATECPSSKSAVEEIAERVQLHPRTIYKCHILARVKKDHAAALESAVEERIARGLALSVNELVNKLSPLLPRPKPRETKPRPAVDRARRAASALVRQLEALADSDVDSAHDIRFVAALLELEASRLLPGDRQLNPLERAELLLQVVADHLESAVLPKLGAAPDTRHPPSCPCDACNNSALMSLEGVVDRLREDASEIERVREGVIAPRSAKDTSYAKPYRIHKPRDDR